MVALLGGKPVLNQVVGVYIPETGRYKWLIVDAIPQFKPGQDKPYQVFASMQDITELRQNQQIDECRLRLLLFAENHSLAELLEETLNEAEKLTESKIGFFHFLEEDQVTILLQNWSTQTKETYCHAEGFGQKYNLDRAGVWADCVRERKPIIHNDYLSVAHRKGLPEGHAAVVRELVVPVKRAQKITAILGVGNKISDYVEEDIEVVAKLADLALDIAEQKLVAMALKNSEAKLKEMNAQKDRFFSIIAHDLRSPFNSIMGFSDLLLEQILEKDYSGLEEYARIIFKSSKRAMDLLVNLLDWARTQTGRIEFNPEYFELAETIEEIVLLLHESAFQKNIAVKTAISGKIPVFADKQMINTVLRNLISNAIKFTHSKGTVSISAYNVSHRPWAY
jgi:K+-sensing histidine kinase KdpD